MLTIRKSVSLLFHIHIHWMGLWLNSYLHCGCEIGIWISQLACDEYYLKTRHEVNSIIFSKYSESYGGLFPNCGRWSSRGPGVLISQVPLANHKNILSSTFSKQFVLWFEFWNLKVVEGRKYLKTASHRLSRSPLLSPRLLKTVISFPILEQWLSIWTAIVCSSWNIAY